MDDKFAGPDVGAPRAPPTAKKKTTTAAVLVLLLSAMRPVYLHCIHCASAGAASVGRYRERKRPLPACLGIVPRASLLQQGFIARWLSSGQECPAPRGDMGSALQAPPGALWGENTAATGATHARGTKSCTAATPGGCSCGFLCPCGRSGCCDRHWRRRGTSGC